VLSFFRVSDLTVKILEQIREEVRGMRTDQRELTGQMNQRFEQMSQRFEVVETTLRDLAEQLVMLTPE